MGNSSSWIIGVLECWNIGINSFYTISNIMTVKSGTLENCFMSILPETVFPLVILRSKATKNLLVNGSAEILRFAQNDMEEFLNGN